MLLRSYELGTAKICPMMSESPGWSDEWGGEGIESPMESKGSGERKAERLRSMAEKAARRGASGFEKGKETRSEGNSGTNGRNEGPCLVDPGFSLTFLGRHLLLLDSLDAISLKVEVISSGVETLGRQKESK
jgi:hypothetical protein